MKYRFHVLGLQITFVWGWHLCLVARIIQALYSIFKKTFALYTM